MRNLRLILRSTFRSIFRFLCGLCLTACGGAVMLLL